MTSRHALGSRRLNQPGEPEESDGARAGRGSGAARVSAGQHHESPRLAASAHLLDHVGRGRAFNAPTSRQVSNEGSACPLLPRRCPGERKVVSYTAVEAGSNRRVARPRFHLASRQVLTHRRSNVRKFTSTGMGSVFARMCLTAESKRRRFPSSVAVAVLATPPRRPTRS